MRAIRVALALVIAFVPAGAASARGPGHGEPASITAGGGTAVTQSPDISDCSTRYSAFGAFTLNLPTTTSVTNYCWFFVNALSGAVLVNIAVTDRINGGTVGASVTVPQGYSAYFYTNALGAWFEDVTAWWPGQGVITKVLPNNPAGNATVTNLMMGLSAGGSPCVITPLYSTRVRFTLQGNLANDTLGSGGQAGLRFGTGSAPANGAAETGTLIGNRVVGNSEANSASLPFSIGGVVTGLTPGVGYWADAEVSRVGAGGTASISSLYCEASEAP